MRVRRGSDDPPTRLPFRPPFADAPGTIHKGILFAGYPGRHRSRGTPAEQWVALSQSGRFGPPTALDLTTRRRAQADAPLRNPRLRVAVREYYLYIGS
eukprot:9088035-Pyramimonas_sp.AAC.2